MSYPKSSIKGFTQPTSHLSKQLQGFYPNGTFHHDSRCRGSNLIGVDPSAWLLAGVVLRRSGVVFF